MVFVDEKILLGSIIAGGSALFFIVLYLINRFRKRRELKQQLKLRNASRAPLSSMRSQRSDRGNARRHIVSRGLQLDQLSGSAQDAYQQRQQRRVAQYSDLQLVMDEIFIPERDAVETEPEEEEMPDDRSTWIAENEDNLNAHANLVAQEEVGTGISVRVSEDEDRDPGRGSRRGPVEPPRCIRAQPIRSCPIRRSSAESRWGWARARSPSIRVSCCDDIMISKIH